MDGLLAEGGEARYLLPQYQKVDVIGAFVGVDRLQVVHVPDDRILERDAVGAVQVHALLDQQRLFDGWEADSLVARDKSRVTGAARRVYESSEFLGLDVTEAYLDVLRAQEVLALSQENVRIHEQILGSLRERGRGGVGSSVHCRRCSSASRSGKASMRIS